MHDHDKSARDLISTRPTATRPTSTRPTSTPLPRSAVALALLLGAGCGGQDEPAQPPPGSAEVAVETDVLAPRAAAPRGEAAAPDPAPEPAVDQARLLEWLGDQQVHDARLVHRALYTWTSAEQARALAAAGPSPRAPALLTRERSPSGQLSLFDRRIARDTSALGRLLRSRHHRARRFAWSNPWATLAGWEGGDYGDQLVRVELRHEAWIAHYDATATPTFRAYTMVGGPVAAQDLAREPERVAAVYHVAEANDGRVYREFVLVNEAMLSRVVVGAPELLARLDEDARELTALATTPVPAAPIPTTPEAWAPHLLALWRTGPEATSPVSLYEAGLAFGSVHYEPGPETWRALARRLEDLPAPAAVVDYRPRTEFPRPPVRRRVRERRPPTPRRFIDPTLG